MKRRKFLKGMVLAGMSPFLPDMKPIIEFAKAVKSGAPVGWANSNSDPLADIQAAAERIRKNTGIKPDTYALSFNGVLYQARIE